jgi:hypothetical protein
VEVASRDKTGTNWKLHFGLLIRVYPPWKSLTTLTLCAAGVLVLGRGAADAETAQKTMKIRVVGRPQR